MIIPWQELEVATLENLIETFVLREGTDYGEQERSLEQKVADVRRQLERGDVVLVWSELHVIRQHYAERRVSRLMHRAVIRGNNAHRPTSQGVLLCQPGIQSLP